MKLFVFLFLAGCAIASPIPNIHADLENAVEEVYQSFMADIEDAGILHAYSDENDLKEEVGKRLKDALSKVLERMKDAVDHGKAIGEDLENKFKEISERLKELKIDMGKNARELLSKIHEKTSKFLKDLFDLLGDKKDKKTRNTEEIQMMDFNLKDLFRNLKKELLGTIDKKKVIAMVEKLFGKGSEMADALEKFINEKGAEYKQKLLDLIDRYLGDKEQFAEQHSIGDYWQKLKDYFKDFKIDLKEKYVKFGEWVKNVANNALDKAKSRKENLTEIAKEFLKNTKDMSREVAIEALDFLRPYQEDLGDLYTRVKEQVKDILMRKEE